MWFVADFSLRRVRASIEKGHGRRLKLVLGVFSHILLVSAVTPDLCQCHLFLVTHQSNTRTPHTPSRVLGEMCEGQLAKKPPSNPEGLQQ